MSLELTHTHDLTDDTALALASTSTEMVISAEAETAETTETADTPQYQLDHGHIEIRPDTPLAAAHAEVESALAKSEHAREHVVKARARAKEERERVGRALVAVRELLPQSGPDSAAWGAYLRHVALAETTARAYMRLVGGADYAPAKRIRPSTAKKTIAPKVIRTSAPTAPAVLAIVSPPKYDDALDEYVALAPKLIALARTSPAALRQVLDALAETARLVQGGMS